MNAHLDIQHLSATYLVPRDLPDPGVVRHRLDAVMRSRLAPVCGRLLSQVLDAEDPSIWLIRRLDVDLTLDAGAVDDELLARAWGHRVATGIARSIARGADSDTVLHFADRAAYLAQFVADLAEGRAWGKWYYRPFDSLRSLPTGAAVREALVREPEQAETVLLRLAGQRRLERVLSVLSAGDAQQVYHTCLAASASGAGGRQLIEALIAAWPVASLRLFPALATAHNALRLYVAVRARSPGLSATGLRAGIDHLLGFAEILRGAAAPEALIARLAADDLRGAIQLARADGLRAHLGSLPFFQQLAAGDSDWLGQVARTVRPVAATRASIADETRATARTLSTPFGGIFLLLPSLLDLGLPELIESAPYPDPQGMGKAQALRYLLILKCLGRSRAMEAAHDPAVHLAAGLDGPPSFETLERFSQSATVAMDQTGLRLLVEGLARRGWVEGWCLSAELVAVEPWDGEVLLLRDVARDAWVYAAHVTDDAAESQAALSQGLTLVREAVDAPSGHLLIGPRLGRCVGVDALTGWEGQVVWMDADETPGIVPLGLGQSSQGDPLTVWTAEPDALPEEMREKLAQFLTRAKPAAQELAYLTLAHLTPPLIANVHFDLTWSLVAHAVLKAFARRLLGFEWSSAEYLYQNFLAGASTVQVAGDGISVQLPNSPLHVVLRMAGVNGQTYTVPWLDDVQVTLGL